MYDDLVRSLPETIDREEILERLERVLDPELDESVLKLGFIESIAADRGHLAVELHLPTYWCAPNFSYLMAEDLRRELLTLENITDVTVRVKDHCSAQEIERGVNAGLSFSEAFPEETAENLEPLRALFLRKGYFKRQEQLLRCLRDAGLSFEEIAHLEVKDLRAADGSCWLARATEELRRVGPAEAAERYLERRRKLGLGDSATEPLIVDLRGERVPAEELERHFVYARTVRVALDANGSLCSALLIARQTARDSHRRTRTEEAHHV